MTETERKYEAASGSSLPALGDVPGVAAEAGPEQLDLEATYFDTADLRLAKAGLTLRRRTGGDDAGWHLKLPKGTDSREELRLPLGRATKKPPKDLASLVRVHTRGAELGPVAQIKTSRQRWQLVDDAGQLLVEVVDDVVTAQTMGESTTTNSWREIEVELGENGTPELLDTVEERLGDAGIHRSEATSKLAQLLGDRLGDKTRKPKAHKKSTAGDVVLAYLHEQAAALKAQDPMVRRQEDDAVHQLRVATRRMRSALQAYGTILEREETQDLIDELKWVAGVLGRQRDLEVLRMRFEDALHALEPELVLGDVAARLTRHFAPLEAQAHNDSVETLDSDRYFALLDSIDRLLADPPITALAAEPARKVLPELITKTYRKLKKRAERALSEEDPHQRDLAMHDSRKAAKRLRYATEIAEPVFGKPAKSYRKQAKDLQTLLGEHQDAVVARPVLRQLGIGDENGFTFGLLHGRETAIVENTAAEFRDRWKGVGKPKF
ncbi:CYTH and CHAD domain-containing protein [Lentzea sp. NBRC 105346]|uniref:CYTH and CHAD domain-containing protein n=1 Tax=Lentzea sp. NBRC 105346 TaxID=3032205 RepID=UPI0025556BBA|nr:CYTH and CHAD domain-containing protein [Lentzea sp. NBRC 105346]